MIELYDCVRMYWLQLFQLGTSADSQDNWKYMAYWNKCSWCLCTPIEQLIMYQFGLQLKF